MAFSLNFPARLLSLGVTLLLAACAGDRVYSTDISSAYTRADIMTAAARGPVPVVISGNPFSGVPADAVGKSLTAAMPTHIAPNLSFVPATADTATATSRIVLVFGSGGSGNRDALCAAAPSATPVPVSSQIEVNAAFCRGPSALTSASGIAPAGAPDSEAVRTLMTNLTTTLLPVRNPLTDDSDRIIILPPSVALSSGFSF